MKCLAYHATRAKLSDQSGDSPQSPFATCQLLNNGAAWLRIVRYTVYDYKAETRCRSDPEMYRTLKCRGVNVGIDNARVDRDGAAR